MRQLQLSVGVFDFRFNSIESKVIFRVDRTPYELVFVKKQVGEVLIITVIPGYRLLFDKETQEHVRSFFETRPGQGFFFKGLAELIAKTVPREAKPPLPADRKAICIATGAEEPGKVYFKNLINWDEVNAKSLSENKKHRTSANLEKTKILYPDLYEAIKDHDISVCYTADPDEGNPIPL